ncbi:transporter substrate-binding domain-containing protein [Sporolactobacillus sp. THM7-7]|nr:transporter substrate-binding domain-containing protein [Sporolactobacillus sp. THM7-7]
MRKLWSTIGFILLFLLLITGCSSGGNGQSSGNKKMDLKMGTEPWIGYGPWWIAEEKGIFKKNGINMEITMFKQDADINAAFASDKIQFANIASHTAMKMIANNDINLKTIVFMDESATADAVITTSKYKDLESLKGKKVAFEEGTTSDLLFRQAIKEQGLTPKDFNVVYMAASDAGLALISHKVDAAVTYEPYIAEIVKKDKSVHRIYTGKDSPGLISDMTAVKADYLEDHPDIKTKMQKVWDEAMDYWKAHPEEGNQIIANATGTSDDELPTILEGVKFFTVNEQKKSLDSGELEKGLDNIKSILDGQKQLKKDVDTHNILAID